MSLNHKYKTEYQAWKAMKARCYAPSNKTSYYQLNGIIVCDKWKTSFNAFLTDMGSCPKGYSLDRINNLGNYEPENCRWATAYEQSKNRGSFNLMFTYNGKTQVLKDWAKELGIKYTTLYQRIVRSKQSFEDAITPNSFGRLLEYNGELKTITEWSQLTGIPYQIIVDRKHRGWTSERIFQQKIRIRYSRT